MFFEHDYFIEYYVFCDVTLSICAQLLLNYYYE